MGFIVVLMLTTLSIAGSAAFFSIYGLAQIFAASFWPVVIMASSLEAGKLVAASYVYRFWKDISFLMKTYLLSAIFVLMVITSAGIFGFLSAAYQTDTLDLRDMESRVMLLEQEKAELYERKKQIDADITRIGANYITKRMELIDKYSPETDRINTRIPAITAEIHELKSKKIQEESHVGPIIYIAKVFDRDIDDATKWMILMIIFAFDPLAVALTIATNNAMLKRAKQKEESPKIEIVRKERVIEHEEDIDPFEVEDINFSEEDLTEDVDDLKLDTDMGEPENLIADIKELFPEYDIEDSEKILRELSQKMKERELTPHEKSQYDRIMKMLQRMKLTKFISEGRKS